MRVVESFQIEGELAFRAANLSAHGAHCAPKAILWLSNKIYSFENFTKASQGANFFLVKTKQFKVSVQKCEAHLRTKKFVGWFVIVLGLF